MNRFKAAGGYTILEVMIVLVVTAALFASVAALLGGKQSATEFTQAVRDYEAKILETSSDVTSGHYENDNLTCFINGAGKVKFNSGASSFGTGSNKECIFLGKILAANTDETRIYSVAGKHYKSDNVTDVENLTDADPAAIITPVNITESYKHKYDLKIENVYTIGSNISVGG